MKTFIHTHNNNEVLTRRKTLTKFLFIYLIALGRKLLHLLKHASHSLLHSLLHFFELTKSFLHFIKTYKFILHSSQRSLQLCNFIIPCLTWVYFNVCESTLATSTTWAWTKSYPTNTTFVLLTHHFGKHIICWPCNTTTYVRWLQMIQRIIKQFLHFVLIFEFEQNKKS